MKQSKSSKKASRNRYTLWTVIAAVSICSNNYQQLLKDHQLICSMSRKGNCWDNAVAESFFHTLKVELICDERFQTREKLQQTVFEYIEIATIGIADTVLLATSARWRLRLNKLLSKVPVGVGQDQMATLASDLTFGS